MSRPIAVVGFAHAIYPAQVMADDPTSEIEMLLPVLWLSRVEEFGPNSSVEGTMVLHHAYEQLGIASHVYTVTLVVKDPKSDEWVERGRPDPRWSDGVWTGTACCG